MKLPKKMFEVKKARGIVDQIVSYRNFSRSLLSAMKTLIPDNFSLLQSIFSVSSRFPSTKSPIIIHSPRSNPWKSKPFVLSCSNFASNDTNFSVYGGWEDLEFMEEAGDWGKLEPLRNLVNSLGIDDKKLALPFLFGFLAALTVSRVRFFTIAVIPVSVFLFLGGFAVGVAQAGFMVKNMGRNGDVFKEKLSQLEALFNDLDGKMVCLRSGIEGGFNVSEVGMGGFENYLQIVEYVRVAIGEAQKMLADSFNNENLNDHIDFDFGGKRMKHKLSRKAMELKPGAIDFFQIFTGIFQDFLVGSKSKKLKDGINDNVGRHLNPVDAKDFFVVSDREVVAGNEIGELCGSQSNSVNREGLNAEEFGLPSNEKWRRMEREIREKERSNNNVWDNGNTFTDDVSIRNRGKHNFKIGSLGGDMFSFDEEDDNQNSSSSGLHFMRNHGSFQKVVFEKNYESGEFDSHFNVSADGNVFQKGTKNIEFLTRESKSSFHESSLGNQNKVHHSSFRIESSELKEKQMNGFGFEESTATLGKYPSLGNHRPTNAKGEGKMPHSSNISLDEKFSDSIKEASFLFKSARESMMTEAGEEQADTALYKAADLLSAAIVMRPMSLVAVGQLGNTYLLHGELKLKVTRELRTLLSRSGSFFSRKQGGLRFKKNASIVTNREEIASVLVSVCEECESLLVNAGRKYRRALSIDGSDVRSLYNWGLALCFRAQLIADVGPVSIDPLI